MAMKLERSFGLNLTLSLIVTFWMIGSSWATVQGNPDIVGTWDFTLESPQGKNTFLFIVKRAEEKLSGVVKSQRGERAVDNFALTGNDLTFTLTIQFQGADMLIAYKGMVEKDSMKGTADFGGLAQGAWSAVRHQETATGSSSSQPQTTSAASAAGDFDISGVWNFSVETAAGSGTPTMTFKQDGKNLSGTYEGQFGKADLKGTLEGSDIRFSFKVDVQGQQLEVTYTGKVEGKDSMKGTVKLGEFAEGTWTARRQP
jgi:hypothetical protein